MDERTDVTAETNDALQGEITDRKRAEVVQRENEEQPRLAPDNLARRDRRVLLGTVLLSLAIFLAVCLAPVRHSVWPILVWPFYLIPLMLTGLTREPRYPPILAALCTVLVVVGFFFTSPGLYPLATIFRHAIGVSILWGTAVLLVRRIREEEVTREQRDLLSESQRVAHIGNWRYYRTGRITWSDELYRICGCSPDRFTPNADLFLNLIHPEDRTAMQAWIAACLAGEKPRELEYRAMLPDGRFRTIRSYGELKCDSYGKPAYISGIAQDITERKQAEEALQAFEDGLRRGRMGTFDWDIAHDRITWSRGLEVLFGGAGQFGSTYEMFAQRVHPEDLPGVNAEVARCMAARDSFAREYRVVWPDGSVHWMAGRGEFTFSDAGQAVGMRGVVLDITEQKRVFEILRRQALMLENMHEAVTVVDEDYNITDWNPAATRMFGYEKTEALGRNVSCLYPPEEAERKLGSIRTGLASAGRWDGELAAVRKDGTRFMVRHVTVPLRDEHGTQIGIIGVSRDISERKRAEAVLRASEARLREYERVVEGLDEMIVVVDREYRYVIANHAFLKHRGLTSEELMGRQIPDVLGSGVFEKVVKAKVDECFLGRVVQYEMNYTYPELGERDLFISYFPIEGPAGVDRVACVLQDVTEHKRAEENMRTLTARILRLQDEERRRIARELHDTTAQGLAGLCLNLSLLGRSAAQWSDKERETLATCRSIAEQSLSELRTVSYLLHPPLLEESGLEPALQWFVEGFTKRSGIRVSLDLAAGLKRLPRDVELSLFRIVQESLLNVHRHSGSQVVTVRLRQDGDVVLEVEDEGFGLAQDWDAIRGKASHLGVGIAGMRERVHQLGGDLQVGPRKPKGTIVRAVIPLGKMVHEVAGPDS